MSCPPTQDVAGVRINNGTVTYKGNAVTGDPPTVTDPTLTPSVDAEHLQPAEGAAPR